jgi:hypothetical protein
MKSHRSSALGTFSSICELAALPSSDRLSSHTDINPERVHGAWLSPLLLATTRLLGTDPVGGGHGTLRTVDDANVREHAVAAVVDIQPHLAAGCGTKFAHIER